MKKYTLVLIERDAEKDIAKDGSFNEHLSNSIKLSDQIGPCYVTADKNTCAAEVIGTYSVKDSVALQILLDKILNKKVL